MSRNTVVLVLLTTLTMSVSLVGQQLQPGPYARIVTIAPKPGHDAAFEAGYQRHLAWHRAQRDPWTWFGWSFVMGPRMDRFMDGTFGHAATDFDHSVDPAGDGADNGVNVEPYADFLSHGLYERLDALSSGVPLPDTTTFLVLETYQIAPLRALEFERLIRAQKAQGRFTWMRLQTGGRAPEYLLMRVAANWATAATLPDYFGDPGGARDLVVSKVSELLRFRPTMSYRP